MLRAVTLNRTYFNDCTLGKLTLPSGLQLVTMERPWLDNRPNISCIPEGEYKATWLERSASGKYRRVWHAQDVPGRSGILFHSGNLAMHSRGCILPGMYHGKLNGTPAALASGRALTAMRRELAGIPFKLVIVS